MKLKTRFRLNTLLSLIVISAIYLWVVAYNNSLNVPQYLSGWLLTLTILLAMMYSIRKRLSMLPILSNAVWLQTHLYTGFVSIWLFLTHIEWLVPSGVLESSLALLFVFVTLSGIFGLWINKALAKQISYNVSYNGGEEVIYERIPGYIERMRLEIEEALIELLEVEPASSLNKYYCEDLYPYFSKPSSTLTYALDWDHHRHYNRRRFNLESQEHYLNDREKLFIEQLKLWVKKKHDLDLHYNYQKILRYWLFTHVPLTYSLYIVSLVHIVATYAFRGGY